MVIARAILSHMNWRRVTALYCSYGTGPDRGFTHYEDYTLDLWHLRPLRTAVIVDRAWSGGGLRGGGSADAATPRGPIPLRGQVARGPLVSRAEGDYVDLRNQADGGEPLFDERSDPDESSDRAGEEAMKPVLRRIRQHLNRMLADPDAKP